MWWATRHRTPPAPAPEAAEAAGDTRRLPTRKRIAPSTAATTRPAATRPAAPRQVAATGGGTPIGKGVACWTGHLRASCNGLHATGPGTMTRGVGT